MEVQLFRKNSTKHLPGSGAGGKGESQATFNSHKKQHKEASHVLLTCSHKGMPLSATALYNHPPGRARAELALPATGTAAGTQGHPSNVFAQNVFFRHAQQSFTQVLPTTGQARAERVSSSSGTALPVLSITREEDLKRWCDKTGSWGSQRTKWDPDMSGKKTDVWRSTKKPASGTKQHHL